MPLLANSSDVVLQELILAAQRDEFDEEDIAALARDLAASGEMLSDLHNAADVASTGGPASLSTLLCPLFLRAYGWSVPKLGVPGRPAGGLDVLSRIPGYAVELSTTEVARVLRDCGYAHFAAGPWIAPLDARLFKLRQQVGAQTVPALVIASLLSKKIAVGIKTVGLDIRVAPHGNFGEDLASARKNAQLFRQVAARLGINATCLLTDASRPYQPYIGRGEAVLALFRLFNGEADHWLRRHADQCAWMAAATIGASVCPAASLPAYDAFSSNVKAQGGSISAFETVARRTADGHKFTVTAPNSGFPRVDLERLRQIIVSRQKQVCGDGIYPDPVGVILLVEDTVEVAAGAALMTVRANEMTNDFLTQIAMCMTVSDVPPVNFGERVVG